MRTTNEEIALAIDVKNALLSGLERANLLGNRKPKQIALDIQIVLNQNNLKIVRK